MPLKSIYTIEVDDSQFKRFKELYDKYQSALKQLPANWEKVGEGAVAVGATAGLITGELEAQVALLVQQELAAQQIDEHSVKSASSWSMVASEARNIEKSLERGTLKLLKWGALATGVLGGLGVLGVGASLFGLDRMAQNVMATRRSALGLGLPYGQYQSFLTNTARLVNPQSVLEGAFQAKYNYPSVAAAEGVLGIGSDFISSHNTGDIAAQNLQAIAKFLSDKPKNMWGKYMQDFGLNQLVPDKDAFAFTNAGPKEQADILKKTRDDAAKMDVSDPDAKKWADFVTQMTRAGNDIEKVFAVALVKLEDPLENLSKDIVKVVDAFANSGLIESWVSGVSTALEKFADYVGTKEFKDSITDFGTWVGSVATELETFLGWFNFITPAKAEGITAPVPGIMQPGDYIGPGGTIVHGTMQPGDYVGPGGTIVHSSKSSVLGGGGGRVEVTGDQGKLAKESYDFWRSEGLSHDQALAALGDERGENVLGSHVRGDFGSAMGSFQWHEDRRQEILAATGIDVDRASHIDELKAARWEMEHGPLGGHMWNKLKNAKSREEAEGYLVHDFERSLNQESDIRNRVGYANQFEPGILNPPKVIIRNNTGNDPVRANAQLSNPTTAYSP